MDKFLIRIFKSHYEFYAYCYRCKGIEIFVNIACAQSLYFAQISIFFCLTAITMFGIKHDKHYFVFVGVDKCT